MKTLSNPNFKWLLLYLLSSCVIALPQEEDFDGVLYEEEYDGVLYEEEYDEDGSSLTAKEAIGISLVGAVGIYIFYYIVYSRSSSAEEDTMLNKLRVYQKKNNLQAKQFFGLLKQQGYTNMNSKVKITEKQVSGKKWTIINGTNFEFGFNTMDIGSSTHPHKLYLGNYHINNFSHNHAVISFFPTQDPNKVSSVCCDLTDNFTIQEVSKEVQYLYFEDQKFNLATLSYAQSSTGILRYFYEKNIKSKEAIEFLNLVKKQQRESPNEKVNIFGYYPGNNLKCTVINDTGLNFKGYKYSDNSCRFYLDGCFITNFSPSNSKKAVISISSTKDSNKVSFAYCILTDNFEIQKKSIVAENYLLSKDVSSKIKKGPKNTMLRKLYNREKEPEAQRFFKMLQKQFDGSPNEKIEIFELSQNKNSLGESIKWTIINNTGLELKVKANKDNKEQPYYLYLLKDNKESCIGYYTHNDAVISIFATGEENEISFSYCNFIKENKIKERKKIRYQYLKW